MEPKKITHFLYCPLTGLGLYGGHRGSRWLKNRINIFKHFVIPSLKAQTNKNFILWISVRYQDKENGTIKDFKEYMNSIKEFKTVFTHYGVCFWDDKYPDDIARSRLADSIHNSVGELLNIPEIESDYILMTIQPSDDVYHKEMVEYMQKTFRDMPEMQALGFRKGYVMDYKTLQIAEWNPDTIPPFFTIKFPTAIFIDPVKHLEYSGPYKSHEYIGNKLKFGFIEERGFVVGCHGENISTHFNHPFKGKEVSRDTLANFGLASIDPIKLPISIRKALMRKLPHGWQKKLRYWFGERFYARIYDFLRS